MTFHAFQAGIIERFEVLYICLLKLVEEGNERMNGEIQKAPSSPQLPETFLAMGKTQLVEDIRHLLILAENVEEHVELRVCQCHCLSATASHGEGFLHLKHYLVFETAFRAGYIASSNESLQNIKPQLFTQSGILKLGHADSRKGPPGYLHYPSQEPCHLIRPYAQVQVDG